MRMSNFFNNNTNSVISTYKNFTNKTRITPFISPENINIDDVVDHSENFFDDNFIKCINELYIYIHRDEHAKEDSLSNALIVCIITLFSASLFKTVLVLLCFFIKWLICDFFCILGSLTKHKCFTLCKQLGYSFSYLKRAGKKIFTYNFYSYDAEIYGDYWKVVIPLIYILFLLGNLLFSILVITELESLKNRCFTNIMLIVVFFLHLFIEIYNALFYIIKDLKKHINYTVYAFTAGLLNLLWLYTLSFYLQNKGESFDVYRRIARLIYLIFFLVCYSYSLSKVYQYDINSTLIIIFKIQFFFLFSTLNYNKKI